MSYLALGSLVESRCGRVRTPARFFWCAGQSCETEWAGQLCGPGGLLARTHRRLQAELGLWRQLRGSISLSGAEGIQARMCTCVPSPPQLALASQGLAHSLSVDGTNDGIFVPPIPHATPLRWALALFVLGQARGIDGRPAGVSQLLAKVSLRRHLGRSSADLKS